MLDFGLVREALHERGLLLQRLAPHLVRPVPFLYPLTQRGSGAALRRRRAGALRHHGLAGSGRARAAAPPAPVQAAGAARRARARKQTRWSARVQYYDAQVDDARHIADAGAHGRGVRRARRQPHARRSASCGRASGSSACGCTTWRPARCSRSGPSRSSTRPASGPTTPRPWSASAASSRCAPPRASTWWCRATGSRLETGLILRTETTVLFVIPWGRHWIIGTTDTDWHLDKAHPAAQQPDIDYLLEHVNAVLGASADARGRRGRLRRAAAAARRRVRVDVEALARARRRRTRCRGSSSSPAASTRRTG